MEKENFTFFYVEQLLTVESRTRIWQLYMADESILRLKRDGTRAETRFRLSCETDESI